MLIAFDLDGTLVDSVADLTAALSSFLKIKGFQPVTIDTVRSAMGGCAADLLERALSVQSQPIPPSSLTVLANEFLDTYDKYDHRESVLYPGAVAVLTALSDRGYRLGVVTNKRVEPALRLLHQHGIGNLFTVVIGGDSTAEIKPSALPLLAAMAACECGAAETTMVGDSINDIEMAKRVGAASVGCRYGFPRHPSELDGADVSINALTDLLPALERLQC